MNAPTKTTDSVIKNRKRVRVKSVPVKSTKRVKILSHYVINPAQCTNSQFSWEFNKRNQTPEAVTLNQPEAEWEPLDITSEEWAKIDKASTEAYIAKSPAAAPQAVTLEITPEQRVIGKLSTTANDSNSSASTFTPPGVPVMNSESLPVFAQTPPGRPSTAASISSGPQGSSRTRAEQTRLLDEKTLLLTKSGSKLVTVGVDPLAYNEPTVRMLNQKTRTGASFTKYEFEQLITALPRILSQIEDTEVVDGVHKIIGELKSHDALLLPNRVVKFRNVSSAEDESVYLAEESLRTLLRLSSHLLTVLREMKESESFFPKLNQFAASLACTVFERKIDVLTDDIVYAEIAEKYNNDLLMVELYTKYYYSVHEEMWRLHDHMLNFNNYNFYDS